MPIISLPDGKTLDFQKEVTGLEIADKISKSLSKQTYKYFLTRKFNPNTRDKDYRRTPR